MSVLPARPAGGRCPRASSCTGWGPTARSRSPRPACGAGWTGSTLVEAGRAVPLALTPGCLVRIPAMLPHAFGSRAGEPLLIVAANAGLGIADDDYAVLAPGGGAEIAAVPPDHLLRAHVAGRA